MPTFLAPWHAQAFAMAASLLDSGHIRISALSTALGEELRTGNYTDDDDGYYQAWLAALEKLLCGAGLVDRPELIERRRAWDRAARSTPHGKPVHL